MAAARAMLEAEGYESIDFLDEGTDESSRRAAFASLPSAEVDPRQMARARQVDGLWSSIWFSLRGNAVVLVPLLVWNAASLIQGTPFGWGDWVGLGLTMLFVAEMTRLLVPTVLYQRMLMAHVWARWGEAHRTGRWLKRFPGAAPFSPFMYDFYEAKALLGLSRAEEAFELYTKWRDHADVPAATFVAMHCALHDQARQFPEKIACLHRLAALQPESAQAWVELALTHARLNSGAAEAAAAIEEASRRELTVLFKAGLEHARGILALDAGDAAASLAHFDAAVTSYPVAGRTPLTALAIADVQAFVSIALIRLGRGVEGQSLWSSVLPLMRVQCAQELLDRYQAALSDRPWVVVP